MHAMSPELLKTTSSKQSPGLTAVLCIVLFWLATAMTPQCRADSPWQWKASLRGTAKAPFSQPTGLFIDRQRERYYVVDSGNNRLVSFDRAGKQLNSFTAANQMRLPLDMHLQDSNLLWVLERGHNSLSRIDFKQRKVDRLPLSAGGNEIFGKRMLVQGGEFFLIDAQSGHLLHFDQQLNFKNRFTGPKDAPGRSAVDLAYHNGMFWLLHRQEKLIMRFSPEGNFRKSFDLGSSVAVPVSLAFGPAGLLYVLDRQRSEIVVFDPAGGEKYRFLSQGHARGQLYFPAQIRFDFQDRLCVVDEGNGRIEIFKRR